ncbi:tRNA adenosine(34) deaminase TadA [Candidatus Sumerlaeota bacterium]|nr:tRNA adenosine(34) deaminase TadA [Candidatus Sumerlaeota bacterium]
MPGFDDHFWMKEALVEAEKAEQKDEIPVGAVIVLNDECIARGHDLRETSGDPTNHAEMIALRKAAKKIGGWRLCDCEMYVTLEPCPMCAGALILSRVKRLVYGAPNLKFGAVGSQCNILSLSGFNHKVEVTPGIMAKECGAILTRFFKNKRNEIQG